MPSAKYVWFDKIFRYKQSKRGGDVENTYQDTSKLKGAKANLKSKIGFQKRFSQHFSIIPQDVTSTYSLLS